MNDVLDETFWVQLDRDVRLGRGLMRRNDGIYAHRLYRCNWAPMSATAKKQVLVKGTDQFGQQCHIPIDSLRREDREFLLDSFDVDVITDPREPA